MGGGNQNDNDDGGGSAGTWILVGLLVLLLAGGVGLTIWLLTRKCPVTWDDVYGEVIAAAEFENPTGVPLQRVTDLIESNCQELQAAYRDPCKVRKLREIAESCPQGIDKVLVRIPSDAFRLMHPVSDEDLEIMDLAFPIQMQYSTDRNYNISDAVPVAGCLTEKQKQEMPDKWAAYFMKKKPTASAEVVKSISDEAAQKYFKEFETCRGEM